jgi:hypothetical protein
MTHTAPTISHGLAWKRNAKGWQLRVGGNVIAFIERDYSRWLCYTSEDTGDDGLLGATRTLAAAKAHLERHAAFALRPDAETELCPF